MPAANKNCGQACFVYCVLLMTEAIHLRVFETNLLSSFLSAHAAETKKISDSTKLAGKWKRAHFHI